MTLSRERPATLARLTTEHAESEPVANRETRAVPLNNIEQINFDGDLVTIKYDGGRVVQMTRAEFQHLRDGKETDLPIDKKVQVDIGHNGDHVVTIEGSAPVTMTKYPFLQKAGQSLVNFVEAGAATYLVQQMTPYGDNSLYSFASNALVLGVIREFVSKEKPGINYLKAEGNGSLLKGLMVTSMVNAGAYGLVLGLSSFSIHIDPDNSHLLAKVNGIMGNRAYQLPILGTAGYLTMQLTRWAGRQAWAYCLPSYEEKINVTPDLNLIQLLGQYEMRWLNDVALTETFLYYIAAFGSQQHAANPQVQIMLLLASDVALQLGEYFSYVPYPVKALIGEPAVEPADVERGHAQHPPLHSRSEEVCVRLGKKAAIVAGICLGAYVISEITAAIMDHHNDDPVERNTLPRRMIRFSTALGIPLAVKYTAENVVPSLVKCCSTLFKRKRAEETHALLIEEPARSYGAAQPK